MAEPSIKQILERYNTIAIVGLSQNPEKDSYKVAQYLQKHGYKILPINPIADKILGQKSYNTLLDMTPDLQKNIEIVDIFRPTEEILAIVNQAIQIKKQHNNLEVIWMQRGIINQQAAEKAKKVGLTVIMNKCVMQEHRQLIGSDKDAEIEKIRSKKMREMAKKSEGRQEISTPIIVTDADFSEIIKKHKIIVIDCWAAWCGPCRIIAPVIDELAKEYAGEIVFGKLNVDENPAIASQFNIMGVPTLLIMKNGAEVDRIVGAAPKSLIQNRLKQYC